MLTSTYALGPSMLGLWDDDRGGLYRSPADWSPQARGAQTLRNTHFCELWRSSAFGYDNGVYLGTSWADMSGTYQPEDLGDGGIRTTYFIKGQVVDGSSVPQTGVLVMGFRSSDNLYIGSVFSNSSGNYSLPTPYSTAHFVVAYLDVATDLAGTTVNNLIPTSTP